MISGGAVLLPVVSGKMIREVAKLIPLDKLMWSLGSHFNKHGRTMGYASKADYDAAAKAFATDMQTKPNTIIIEGEWNGAGQLNGTTQRAIINDGTTVIVDSKTGQVIDFYEGTELKGLINQRQVKIKD